MEETELKSILLKMLQAELDAMHYYQQAARLLQDEDAIYHFNLLAQEELEHARTFYAVYPDKELPSFAELLKTGSNLPTTRGVLDPQRIGRLDERAALQLAIEMENRLADDLKQMLEEIHSPAARAVIEENIKSTLGHSELIEDDFLRIFERPANL